MTIEGIDSDGDGLRDDIQRYIAGKSLDTSLKEDVKTLAKKIQDHMLIADDELASNNLMKEKLRFIECIEYDYGDRSELIQNLHVEAFDTYKRLNVLSEIMENFGGETIVSKSQKELKGQCEGGSN